MSRGVCHGASDHMSVDRPGGARQAMMAADRLHAGRDYAWRGARRIILRSGDIAVRNTPAAGRCVRACAFVTSDGIGGTDGLGGTVPLFVTSDGIGGTDFLGGAVPLFVTSDGIGGTDFLGGAVPLFVTSDGIGGTDFLGGAVPLFVTSDGIGGTDGLGGAVRLFVTSDGIGGTDGLGGAVPLRDGRGRVVAGPGSGWGTAGSAMVSSFGSAGKLAVVGGRRPVPDANDIPASRN